MLAGGFALSACGGSSEAPRSPVAAATESQPADTSAASAADAPPEAAEPAAAGAEPSEAPSDTAASDRLALELEKRREAAKARAEPEGDEKGSTPEEAPVAAEPAYAGPDPCRATSFSIDRVREACASGGRASAKRVMKDAITKAIAMSHSLKCDDCHVNQRDYALKPNAVAELKRWLESSE